MSGTVVLSDVWSVRRVFETWSIELPVSMDETFVPDGYWHAFEARRSVSLTSQVITERGEPVPAAAIASQLPSMVEGAPVDWLPAGVLGEAAISDAVGPAIASRILQAVLIAEGRILLVTITADDDEWLHRVWRSIRMHRSSAMYATLRRRGRTRKPHH
jgi:hypothetical protein